MTVKECTSDWLLSVSVPSVYMYLFTSSYLLGTFELPMDPSFPSTVLVPISMFLLTKHLSCVTNTDMSLKITPDHMLKAVRILASEHVLSYGTIMSLTVHVLLFIHWLFPLLLLVLFLCCVNVWCFILCHGCFLFMCCCYFFSPV